MANAVEDYYSSESDDDCSYYSGQARRFELQKKVMFPVGVVRLVETSETAAVPVRKPYTRSGVTSATSTANDVDSDDDILACKKKKSESSQQLSPLAKKIETLEDMEDYVDLSPDVSFTAALCEDDAESSLILHNPPSPGGHSLQDLLLDCDEPTNESDKILVKVRFRSELNRLELSKDQYFKIITHQLSEKYKLPQNTIVLYLNDRLLGAYDSPKTVRISITDIIEGYSTGGDAAEAAAGASEDTLQLKVQSKARGSAITISIRGDDCMQVLMDKYAEQTGADPDKLRFFFDGEALQPDDTPASLDLEGGECIDVHFK